MTQEIGSFENFILLFRKLKSLCIKAEDVSDVANKNYEVQRLCVEIGSLAFFTFKLDETRDRRLFRNNVNSAFIDAWRDYEENWDEEIFDVYWSYLTEDTCSPAIPTDTNTKDAFVRAWELADEEGRAIVAGFQEAMQRGLESVEIGDFPDGYAEGIEESQRRFNLLWVDTGVDLRGIIRRRKLTPLILIPSHVSKKHGIVFGCDTSKLSLQLQMREAQESFTAGLPLASLSHMRAIMELVLTHHYGFSDMDLIQKIDMLRYESIKKRLHRLRKIANDILHSEQRTKQDPFRERLLKDMGTYAALLAGNTPVDVKKRETVIRAERELVVYLKDLRSLIENAPRK